MRSALLHGTDNVGVVGRLVDLAVVLLEFDIIVVELRQIVLPSATELPIIVHLVCCLHHVAGVVSGGVRSTRASTNRSFIVRVDIVLLSAAIQFNLNSAKGLREFTCSHAFLH